MGYIIYYQNIDGLFSAGQPAHQFLTKRNREVKVRAAQLAPKRTGNLARSVRNVGVRKNGPYRATGQISADADYAFFVHDGTRGPITARGGGVMILRTPHPRGIGGKGGTGGFGVRSVRGQRANPFLLRAAQQVMSRYGVLVTRAGGMKF